MTDSSPHLMRTLRSPGENYSSRATTIVPSESNEQLKSLWKNVLSDLDRILIREDWKPEHVEVGRVLNSCLLKLKLWSVDIGDADKTLPKVEAQCESLAKATTDRLQAIAAQVSTVEAAVFNPTTGGSER